MIDLDMVEIKRMQVAHHMNMLQICEVTYP